MATLTWQDVAGQVRAPDYSDAGALITQGIQGLGKSVADLGSAPEQRRQAALAKEMMLVDMQAKGVQQHADLGIQLGKELDVRTEKKDMKEFSKNQSYLESASRKAGMAGIPLPDFLATDKVYQSMGDGAKAYSAANLSDAYTRGDETRISMAERAAENARQERHFQIQLAESRADRAEAARSRAEAARSRKIEDEAAQIRLDELKRAEADRKFLDTPLGILTARAGANYNDAIGKKYENMDWGGIAKASGIKGYSEYLENLRALNAKRLEQNKRPLPEGAAKSVLAAQIGKNTGIPSVFNEVDGSDIDKQLLLMADQFDASLRETDVLNRFKAMQDKGIPFKDSDVLAELARANPPADKKRKPVDPPFRMYIN